MLLNARRFLPLIALFFLVTACAPTPSGVGDPLRKPELTDANFLARDGASLPVRIWNSRVIEPNAVIVALHGFNDYSNAFSEVAEYWKKEHRIYTYAYDQRGFGDTAEPGNWAGTEAYVQDLRDFCDAVRQRFPNAPLYVLGESMGGAIAMVAFASDNPPDADGVILSAPAVWARETMPWYQRLALFVGAHTIPWASFTGEGLGVVASDNRDMLIALGRDPKVIKATRVAALYGLTNLMDEALQSADHLKVPALILIGELDEVVPNHASASMLERLPEAEQLHTAIYDQGYHMLMRDLQRQTVWNDMAAWAKAPKGDLPSGADDKNVDRWIKLNK